MELVKPGTKIDFVGMRKYAGVFSAFMVLTSVILFFIVKPNWGIDFTGGTEIVLQFEEDVEIGELRTALTAIGLGSDAVQQINAPSDNQFSVRIQEVGFGTEGMQEEVIAAFESQYGDDWVVSSVFDAQVGATQTIEHKPPEISATVLDQILTDAGIVGHQVRESPDDNVIYVGFQGLSSQIQKVVASALVGMPFDVIQVDEVGPKVGGDLRRQAFLAMAATLGLVLVYVGVRFDMTFAPGAILALFHDVAITIGIFTLLQNEINLSMIGALLTIIGYSLNDTIVIYDRIRENMERYRRSDMAALINDSVNETLARTLATSITTLLAITAFYFWGGPVISMFAEAMIIGVVVGTYSTVFVASPSILIMEKVKPHILKIITPAGAGVQMGEATTDVAPPSAE